MRAGVFSASVLAALLASSGAAAQPHDASVDALLRRGVALRQRGDDEGALDVFRRAREVSDEPRVLAQIALAEQALGRWVDAARDLRAAVAHEDDRWIRRNAAALASARDEIMRHVGGLELRGEGARAGTLHVDDAAVAELPMREPTMVLSGQRVLEVRAEGFTPWRRRVEVRAGELNHVDVPALQAILPTPIAPPPPPRRSQAQRLVGWSLVGASAVALGIGIYGFVARDDAQSGLDRDPQCAADPSGGVCSARRDAVDTNNVVMIAGLASAGVLAAAGVILVLTAPSSRPAATLVCAPGWRSLGCAVRF